MYILYMTPVLHTTCRLCYRRVEDWFRPILIHAFSCLKLQLPGLTRVADSDASSCEAGGILDIYII